MLASDCSPASEEQRVRDKLLYKLSSIKIHLCIVMTGEEHIEGTRLILCVLDLLSIGLTFIPR